LANDEIIQIIS